MFASGRLQKILKIPLGKNKQPRPTGRGIFMSFRAAFSAPESGGGILSKIPHFAMINDNGDDNKRRLLLRILALAAFAHA